MYRIFCVTAHPDDEAANFGGTLARLSEQGHQIYLVCLTSGEAARNRGTAKTNEELMALRTQELAASCKLLGVQRHDIWRYPDGGLQRVDFYEAAGRLVECIRQWRPHVVLTMGPEGAVTGHPDHGMSSLMATAAFHWAAQERYYPGQKLQPWQADRLYYATDVTRPEGFPKVHLPPAHVVVEISPYLGRKIAAFKLHATQAGLFELVEQFIRRNNGTERFHLASAAMGFDLTTLHNDLLAGLGEPVADNPVAQDAGHQVSCTES